MTDDEPKPTPSLYDAITEALSAHPTESGDLVGNLVRAVGRAGWVYPGPSTEPRTVEEVYQLAATNPQAFRRWATSARTLLSSILMVDTSQLNVLIVNAILGTQED